MELPVLILLEKRDVDSVDCTVWDDNGGVDRLIVVAAVVDGDGDDVFLVVDAVYDIRVRAPDGTSHVTPTTPPLPSEKSKHIFLSSIKTK